MSDKNNVNNFLDFAEWIDINGIRYGRHEWKYKGDNYSRKWTTLEMFMEWKNLKP